MGTCGRPKRQFYIPTATWPTWPIAYNWHHRPLWPVPLGSPGRFMGELGMAERAPGSNRRGLHELREVVLRNLGSIIAKARAWPKLLSAGLIVTIVCGGLGLCVALFVDWASAALLLCGVTNLDTACENSCLYARPFCASPTKTPTPTPVPSSTPVPSATEAATTTQTASATSSSTPTATATPSPGEAAAAALVGYFELADDGLFNEAWDLLSPHYKATENASGYDNYVAYWETVEGVRITSPEVYDEDPAKALLETNIIYRYRPSGAEGTPVPGCFEMALVEDSRIFGMTNEGTVGKGWMLNEEWPGNCAARPVP